jgi:hypothetical protein
MNSVNSIFSRCITLYLSDCGSIPSCLETLIAKSVTSLIDSEMIIEDNFKSMAELKSTRVALPLESFEQTLFIDQLIEQIKRQGFGENFHQIIGLFGSIMMGLCASEQQIESVESWLKQGHFGHFMMTDNGGPTLSNWHSIISPGASDGELKVQLNKKWVIEGHKLGFAMVVCQQQGRPFPTTVLLSPQKTKKLVASTCGASFLDGKLQLGNIIGEAIINKSDLLTKGGLGGVNRFLTLVRPRFVKALMHHLIWLHGNNRLELTPNDILRLNFIIDAADWCNQQNVFSIHSVDRVLALKFVSNQFLLHLVENDRVIQLSDQRDLLGFSKMEGSSYRCLFEIYSKFKRARV